MKKPFVWFLLLVTLSLEAYGSSLRDHITTPVSEQYGKNQRRLQEGESEVLQNTTGPIGSDNSTWSPYPLESTTGDTANSNSANEPFVLENADTNSTNSTNPDPVSDDTSDDKTAANRTVIIVVAIVCAVCIIGLGLLLFRIQSMRKAQLEAEAKESQNVIELNNTSSASTMKINENFQVFDRKNDSVSVIVNIDPKMTPTKVYVNNEIL